MFSIDFGIQGFGAYVRNAIASLMRQSGGFEVSVADYWAQADFPFSIQQTSSNAAYPGRVTLGKNWPTKDRRFQGSRKTLATTVFGGRRNHCRVNNGLV